MSRRRNIKRFSMPELALTPLIDTALTLLVIFMVTAPMVQNGIKLELPQGEMRETSGTQDCVVSITKEGKLFLNASPIDENRLYRDVARMVSSNPEMPVYIQGDKVASYGDVVRIVDGLKNKAHVQYVGMSTKQA